MIATKLFDDLDLGETRSWRDKLHRWLDPAVGRWISEDPIGFAAGDANVYRYVGNNTSRVIDPTGLEGVGDRCWREIRVLRDPSTPIGPTPPWLDWLNYFNFWDNVYTPIATQAPGGLDSAAGALQTAPGLIRAADVARAKQAYEAALNDPNASEAKRQVLFDEWRRARELNNEIQEQ